MEEKNNRFLCVKPFLMGTSDNVAYSLREGTSWEVFSLGDTYLFSSINHAGGIALLPAKEFNINTFLDCFEEIKE